MENQTLSLSSYFEEMWDKLSELDIVAIPKNTELVPRFE